MLTMCFVESTTLLLIANISNVDDPYVTAKAPLCSMGPHMHCAPGDGNPSTCLVQDKGRFEHGVPVEERRERHCNSLKPRPAFLPLW